MVHRFGTFEFDADSGELRRNGRAVALEPQPARLLHGFSLGLATL